MGKGALTAYFIFMKERRPAVVEANPDLKLTQISKVLGAEWKELDEGEKADYREKAAEDKLRYAEEVEAFKAAGGNMEKKQRKKKGTRAKKVESEDEENGEETD